jgi:ABC-type phosphate transport system substrate-binding protein
MRASNRLLLTSAALAALLFGAVRPAEAAQCSALTKLGPGGATTTTPAPPVVYVTGSSAVKPFIAALAPAISAATTRPATIVYRSQGSCLGVSAVVSGTAMATNDTTNASYWDPNSVQLQTSTKTLKEETCTLDNGTIADVGVSDVFAQTCGQALQGLPSNLADFQGPIQAMTFAVNKGSKESSISAEAAYLTFGLRALDPWTDKAFLFRRNSGSGTQQMISAAINVDAKSWTGVDANGSDGVYNGLAGLVAQGDKDKAIGILAADYSSRPELKQLAYQHYGQRCGYRPDIQGADKRNVRDGQYAIWGPLHLLSQVDGSGLAKKLEARDLISYLLGSTPPPLGVDLIRTEAQLHVVPPCAMKVQRKAEMGPITPFKPERACSCAFDREAVGSTTCKACSSNSECGANQSCNFGFCEAQ